MGGFLDALRMAVPGVTAARSGYMQGQEQEADKQQQLARQGVLDRLKQAMDESTVDENKARAQYYRDGGAGGDGVTYLKGDDGEYHAMPKKMKGVNGGGAASGTSSSSNSSPSGVAAVPSVARSDNDGGRTSDMTEAAGGASTTAPSTSLGVSTGVYSPKAAVKAPAGPRLAKSSEINPADGTVNDVFSDGTRKFVRKATPDEIARATHIPGTKSGGGAAGGATGADGMKPNIRETYLQAVADRAIKASGGDIQKAEFAVANDPQGQKAYSSGLSTRHFATAKATFDRQGAIDRDVHPAMDTAAAAGPPPKAGGAPQPKPITTTSSPTYSAGGPLHTVKTAIERAGPAKPITLGQPEAPGTTPAPATPARPPADAAVERAQQEKATVALSKSPRVQQALTFLRSKKGTMAQLDASGNFTPQEKAYIKAAFASQPQ